MAGPIPVYVIHARKLAERVAHMRRELDRAGLACEWITVFDPEDFTPEIERRYFVDSADLTPG